MTATNTRDASYDSTGDPLALCRQDIDRVDAMLVALLRERTRLALDVGRIKRAHGLAVAHPAREVDVLTRVRQLAGGPLDADVAARIFERIILETRALQHGESEDSPALDAAAVGTVES